MDKERPPDVSIVVVGWNTRSLVKKCLQSIIDQTEHTIYDVIYVDNASTDGTVEMIRSLYPAVKVLRNERNLGFSRANNQGIRQAKGRYVLLLNSDTVILDNAIGTTVRIADANQRTAVIGCRIQNPDGSLQPSCSMTHSLLNLLLRALYLYKFFPRSRFFARQRMGWWKFDTQREVETIFGCFLLVRREAIEEVGLLDEGFFMYCEDVDWCYRFRKHGWRVLFTPEARIIHYGGQTARQMPNDLLLQLYGSCLLFMKKRNRLTFPLARLIVALYFLIRVPYWLFHAVVSRGAEPHALERVATYLRGAYFSLVGWRSLLIDPTSLAARSDPTP